MADNEAGPDQPGPNGDREPDKKVKIIAPEGGGDEPDLEPLDVGELGFDDADDDTGDTGRPEDANEVPEPEPAAEAVTEQPESVEKAPVAAQEPAAGEAPARKPPVDVSDPLSLPLPAMAPGTAPPSREDAGVDAADIPVDDDMVTAELELPSRQPAEPTGDAPAPDAPGVEEEADSVAESPEVETPRVRADDDVPAGAEDEEAEQSLSAVETEADAPDAPESSAAIPIVDFESAVERRRRDRGVPEPPAPEFRPSEADDIEDEEAVDAEAGEPASTSEPEVELQSETEIGSKPEPGVVDEAEEPEDAGAEDAGAEDAEAEDAEAEDAPAGGDVVGSVIGAEGVSASDLDDDDSPIIRVTPDRLPEPDSEPEPISSADGEVTRVAEPVSAAAAVADEAAGVGEIGYEGAVARREYGGDEEVEEVEEDEYHAAHKAETSPEAPPASAVAIKVGTGLAFGAVALLIILVFGEQGLAGLGILLITWVAVEYYGAIYQAAGIVEEGLEDETGTLVGEQEPEPAELDAEVSDSGLISLLGIPTQPPAAIVGVAATLAMSILAYLSGAEAMGVVAAFGIVACALWFLGTQRPGVAPTDPVLSILGVVHIGVLGSFAFLILRGENGQALLLTTVILTIVMDVAAYGWGLSFGRRPLAPSISPNKSIEGLVGGVATVFVTAIVIAFLEPLHDVEFLGSLSNMLIVAAVVSAFAAVGDLSESVIKRSLGIKDMGSFLPGHGGMFDRLDALLFVLPAAYVTFRLLGISP